MALDLPISDRVLRDALSYYTSSEIEKVDRDKFSAEVAEHLNNLASNKKEVLNKSRIKGETLDLEEKRLSTLIESTEKDIELLKSDEKELRDHLAESSHKLMVIKALYDKAKEHHDNILLERHSVSRQITTLLQHAKRYTDERDMVAQQKNDFLIARDAKNYFGGGIPLPDEQCFLECMDVKSLRDKLNLDDNGVFKWFGNEKKLDDFNCTQLHDFCMFLKNGGYNHNPMMKKLGTSVHVSRMKNFLGQNESIFEQIERVKMYLGLVPPSDDDTYAYAAQGSDTTSNITCDERSESWSSPRTPSSSKKRAIEEFLSFLDLTPRMTKKSRCDRVLSVPHDCQSPSARSHTFKKEATISSQRGRATRRKISAISHESHNSPENNASFLAQIHEIISNNAEVEEFFLCNGV